MFNATPQSNESSGVRNSRTSSTTGGTVGVKQQKNKKEVGGGGAKSVVGIGGSVTGKRSSMQSSSSKVSGISSKSNSKLKRANTEDQGGSSSTSCVKNNGIRKLSEIPSDDVEMIRGGEGDQLDDDESSKLLISQTMSDKLVTKNGGNNSSSSSDKWSFKSSLSSCWFDGYWGSMGYSSISRMSGWDNIKGNLVSRRLPRRYIVAMLAFFGFCIIYMLRVNLSVAIVAMTTEKTHTKEKSVSKNVTHDDDSHGWHEKISVVTLTSTYRDFDWDSHTQGMILGAFFYGYIFTQIPGGYMATKYGGKVIFLTGIAATSLLTLVTPLMANLGTPFLVATRVLEGLFEGMTYPSIHAIWAKWAPPSERTCLAALAFSGSYVGTVITLPISGLLAENVGWESVFYVFGVVGVIWCVAWYLIVYDSPENDPNLTLQELEYLKASIDVSHADQSMSPPWRAMLTSPAVFAIIAAHFAENWGFYTLLTGLPMFMRDVLDYKIDEAGFLAAFPYILMACIVQSAGFLADYARSSGQLTTTQVRKIFTCASYLCQTIFMSITSILISTHHSSSVIITFISLSLGCGGFAWAGFSINHLDIAPQYAALLMGISNTVGTIPGILSPSVTGYIVKNGTAEEWSVVFLITASIYYGGAVIYVLLASGQRQKWSRSSSVASTVTTKDGILIDDSNDLSTTSNIQPLY